MSVTALATPPLLADYPPGSYITTVFFLCLMLGGWVMSWLAQLCFSFTIGAFLPKHRYHYWNGYLFRLLAAGTVSRLTPGIRVRKLPTAWQPDKDILDGKKPVLFVANHRSFMDPFALGGALLPLETKYVAKYDLFKVPFGGWAMRRAGDLAVKFDKNRNKGWGTVKGSTGQLLLQATDHFTHGNSILIFPEGTRMGFDADKAKEAQSHPSKLMPFKAPFFDLAKKLKVPVVCVACKGTDDVWPVGSNMIRPATVTVDVSQPMNADDYATDLEFAEAARLKLGTMYQDLCK